MKEEAIMRVLNDIENLTDRIENLEEMMRNVIKELYDVWEISMGEDI